MPDIMDRREGERRDYGDDWTRDSVRMYGALTALSRFLVERKDDADAVAARLNAHAKAIGAPFDRRADSAEGAAGAYAVAISALIGALRVANVEEITGVRSMWMAQPMMRPELPGELLETPEDLASGDHFAGMPEGEKGP